MHKPNYIKVTKQDTEALNAFYNEVNACLANVGLNTYINTNPNINYNAIHQIIQQAKINHLPEMIIKFNKHKHKLPPWITRGILKSIQYRDNMYKVHKMINSNLIEFKTQKINLKTYNAILKKAI